MKPKIGKGSASPPQSAPDKATLLRLLRGAPFGLKAEVLNQQGRLINDNPPENNCRPSVDVLFRSVATHFKGKVLAVIMTGMGRDGTEGVRLLKQGGHKCIIQDEASSVVWGMPGSIHDAGLADEVVPLDRLAAKISALVL
jgi:two-component system chemotaxis response regulator CheB